MAQGLLISQIGYDLFDPIRALYRADQETFLSDAAYFTVTDPAGETIVNEGPVQYWGEKWKTHWWEMDFSGTESGEYELRLYDQGKLIANEPFEVGSSLLWHKTAEKVGIDQFEERARRARNQIGWKDCGAVLRESVSHAIALIGLTEFLLMGFEWLGAQGQHRLRKQLMQGADYLSILADRAVKTGHPEGSMFHEIPRHMLILPRSIAQSIIAWARVSALLADTDPEQSLQYLKRAEAGYRYFKNGLKPYSDLGFSRTNHGAPKDYQKPDEWETRDLILWMWGGLELVHAGLEIYQDDVICLADQIMERQVTEREAEDGLYGHFFSFSDRAFTQKANVHHHIGHDTGGVFPYNVVPFIELISLAPDHTNIPKWRKTVMDFAYGFFLPACKRNPFYIMPEGYFPKEGLLNFCGPWHGMNTTLCFAATLAMKLESFTGDAAFRSITVGNLQWIAGLNVGVTKESFLSSWKFKMALGDNEVVPLSQIHKIGKRYAGCWTDIQGTIMNGYSANPQFQLSVEPTLENDVPANFTDEDWIPHGAAFVSALANLRLHRYLKNPQQAFDE